MRLIQNLYVQFDDNRVSMFTSDVEVQLKDAEYRYKVRNIKGRYIMKREDGKKKEFKCLEDLYNFIFIKKLELRKEQYLWLK